MSAAVRFARRQLEAQRGVPQGIDQQRSRFVVLALGKLGGEELNYSSDIDLICLYEMDGQTSGARSLSNQEFYERLVPDVVQLLTEATELGTTYRVDLRLRPEGLQGPVVCSLESAWHYYDGKGRTWERQAMIKAPKVGSLSRLVRHCSPYLPLPCNVECAGNGGSKVDPCPASVPTVSTAKPIQSLS